MKYKDIITATRDALIKASTTFRPDQMDAYRKAYQEETSESSRWVLKQIIANAEIATKEKMPLCDDTGIPHVVLEIGTNSTIKGEVFLAIEEGIAKGLRELPGRPMALRGDGLGLLGQTEGIYEQADKLTMAPIHVRYAKGSSLKISVLMLGGGPEIRGRTLPVFHKHEGAIIIEEVIKWVVGDIGKLGCTPGVLFVGIGRTQYEASSMAIKAMYEANFSKQSQIETYVTNEVNKTRVGSLGLGGDKTILGSFVQIGPQRASGVRITSLRLGCCYDPRRASVTLA